MRKKSTPLPISAEPMPQAFSQYVKQGEKLAADAGLRWNIETDPSGIALDGQAWDLRQLLKDGNPAQEKLRTFSIIPKALQALVASGLRPKDTSIALRPVSPTWRDFMKAYAANHLLVNGLSMQHLKSVCRAIRLIATVTDDKAPWRLDADDLRSCMSIAKEIEPSGQSVVLIASFVKTVIDAYYLAHACPLYPLIADARAAGPVGYRTAKFAAKEDGLRDQLAQRKGEAKLPERKAFWELMRIIFTEKPRSFLDAIRFAQLRVLAITGFRIGENAFIPLDWKQIVDYRDFDGTPAGERGGFSHALLLRYFAEKQGSSRRELGTLYEDSQYVPAMFEEILIHTLDDVERWTAPMRKILKAQCETGRVLPMYAPDKIVPAEEIYLRLTGTVLFRNIEGDVYQPYLDRYRATFDPQVLDELVRFQRKHCPQVRNAWYVFAERAHEQGLIFRDSDGVRWDGGGAARQFLRVDDVEKYLRAHKQTKLSDTMPFRLNDGADFPPWKMLFLVPKRAVGEGRNALPCHTGWNVAIGVATPEILGNALQSTDGYSSLFQTYGATEEDRKLTFQSKSLRHLQNTELFRLGVADTIISKRFNRHSVAKSYEYDHRNLQEELEQIELPDEWEAYLGPKAASVAKLIELGRANGPIVKEFKRLQAAEGDESAFSFLKAEADGFHATPYGHCLNSFTVDPCPSHLECFNNCRHLSATDMPENRQHLILLQGKLKDALEAARARPARSVGRKNQIKHAVTRLKGVERLLATPAGERVFPDGDDLSKCTTPQSVLRGA